MPSRPELCNFCYRQAARVLVQRRRTLRQVLSKMPPRRANVCATARCEHVAEDYLTTGVTL
jgi:hypothetical protein